MSVREGFSGAHCMKFKSERQYETVSLSHAVNKNETAAIFEVKQILIVYVIGGNAVPIRCKGSNSGSTTVFSSGSCDETKPSLFIIFKS